MATIKQMNRVLTDYLIPEGSKQREHIGYKIGFEFHKDYQLLMLALSKAIGEGEKHKDDREVFWYAVYPRVKNTGTWENQKYAITGYSCAFSKNGYGRMGHGTKFNNDFLKKTQMLAIHYSLYRLVKNGLEY